MDAQAKARRAEQLRRAQTPSGPQGLSEGVGHVPSMPGFEGLQDLPPGRDLGPLSTPPIFGEEEKRAAADALETAAPVDPEHPFAKHRATLQRRLGQLDIPRQNENRILVQDVDEAHAAKVTRALAGETALSQGAKVWLSVPDAPHRAAPVEGSMGMQEAPTTGDALVQQAGANLLSSVEDTTRSVQRISAAAAERADGHKTFVNFSFGHSVNNEADRITEAMLRAPVGSPLYEEARAHLQEPPVLHQIVQDGETITVLDEAQRARLKQAYVIPKLDRMLQSEAFGKRMGDARLNLSRAVDEARQNNVMVFQATGNEFAQTLAMGRPDLSESITSGIEGIFRVGAHDGQGAQATIADFSSAGDVDASIFGVNIPVEAEDGVAVGVNGTSYSNPIMVDTAYVMSGANPELSLDELEALLEDPRVALDIQDTQRDGAGAVDSFAAIVLARHPNLNRAQLDRIAATLDANPQAQFRIEPSGALVML